MIELIHGILTGTMKLVFFIYVVILVIMGVCGIIGLTSIMFFFSEIVMLIIGFIIYKVRREAYGPNDFSVIWATCTMVGFWPMLIWGIGGLAITVFARFFYLTVCYK